MLIGSKNTLKKQPFHLALATSKTIVWPFWVKIPTLCIVVLNAIFIKMSSKVSIQMHLKMSYIIGSTTAFIRRTLLKIITGASFEEVKD